MRVRYKTSLNEAFLRADSRGRFLRRGGHCVLLGLMTLALGCEYQQDTAQGPHVVVRQINPDAGSNSNDNNTGTNTSPYTGTYTGTNTDINTNTGTNTTTGDDPCAPNPCQHGGVCLLVEDATFCDCTNTGYTGDFCENLETTPLVCTPGVVEPGLDAEPSAEELCALNENDLGPYLSYDSFTRSSGNNIGSAEVGGFAWNESNPEDTQYIRLTGDALYMHYFAGDDGSQPNQWVSLSQLKVADPVIDFRMRTHSESYDTLMGMSYRLPKQEGARKSSGYHLYLENGALTLYAGRVVLDTVSINDDHDWHNYRVVALGDAHCVYMDDALLIATRNNIYPRSGYVGFTSFYSIGWIDDVGVAEHPQGTSDPAAPFDVFEHFERPDGQSLGVSAKGGDFWLSSASGETDLSNDTLLMNGASSSSPGLFAMGLQSYRAAAMEISFRAQASQDDFSTNSFLGLSYRTSAPLAAADAAGYHLWLGDGVLELRAGQTVIATSTEGIDNMPHDFQVMVAGHAHKVYRDGILVLDVVDDTYSASGALGFFMQDGSAYLDDFGVRTLDPDPVYPVMANDFPGVSRFPILFYSVSHERIPEVVAQGATLVHRYASVDNDEREKFLEEAALSKVRALGTIGSYHVSDNPPPISIESEVKTVIERMSAAPNMGWWNYPEELKTWYTNTELLEMQNLFNWTRQYDPQQNPTFMYNPNHRTAAGLAEIVPYMDVIGKGAYVSYADQPRAWVRYQIESTIEGIELAGREVGPDYLAGERVPMLIAGVWHLHPASAQEIYHDVYSGIASGAKAIALYSHLHALKEESSDGLDGFVKAAGEIGLGEGRLGPAILYGLASQDISFEILEGPLNTVDFTPYGYTQPFSYPCLNWRAWDYEGKRTIVAVNSCEEQIEVRFSGFDDEREILLPFEGRRLCAEEGQLEESFEALGVHIYQIEL